MYEARSLPDNPQGWAVLVAFVVIYVAVQCVLPERLKEGWRKHAVNGVLIVAGAAALIAVHA